jgi:hypothetical protein
MPQNQTFVKTCSQPLHNLLICGPICSRESHSRGLHGDGHFYWEDGLRVSADELTNFLLAVQKLPLGSSLSIQLNADGSVKIEDIKTFVRITK